MQLQGYSGRDLLPNEIPLVFSDRPLLVHHVARICHISKRAVRWAAQHGHLKGFKDPSTPKIWRFRRDDVIAYLKKRRNRRRVCYPKKERVR
jgi:hypothetical protein